MFLNISFNLFYIARTLFQSPENFNFMHLFFGRGGRSPSKDHFYDINEDKINS